MKTKKALSWLGTICFSVIGIIYIAPIIIVLINSFKQKNFISLEPFKLPTEETWFGIGNYLSAIDDYGFIEAVGWTVFITIASVLVILVCTSMSLPAMRWTIAGMSTSGIVEVISPVTNTTPCPPQVSAATRALGSFLRYASKIASLI